jgi:YjbE family integral membrane protein
MDFLTDPLFWSGLGQIMVVNLLLSGDNAVVIALASRRLPEPQRKLSIFWGSVGAVVLRIAFVLIIAWLLAVPFLKLAGGLLLLWIGVKLMVPEHGDGDGKIKAGPSLMAAIRTIIIADAVMSLDNVIAIVAAAKGDMLLLIVGLLISMPIVLFGSQIVLKFLIRFPILVTAGAGLLGWIAGEIMIDDIVVRDWVHHNAAWLHDWRGACVIGALFVVTIGLAVKRRFEAKAAAHVEDLAAAEKAP